MGDLQRGVTTHRKNPQILSAVPHSRALTPSFCVLESFVYRRKTILIRIMVITALNKPYQLPHRVCHALD
jgi:hypothetical protein